MSQTLATTRCHSVATVDSSQHTTRALPTFDPADLIVTNGGFGLIEATVTWPDTSVIQHRFSESDPNANFMAIEQAPTLADCWPIVGR